MFNTRDCYRKICEATKSSKLLDPKVCKKVMDVMLEQDPDLFDRVNDLAEETTFTVRNYGKGAFYCYPYHKDLKDCSPWPASRFPKASLCVAFALEIQ